MRALVHALPPWSLPQGRTTPASLLTPPPTRKPSIAKPVFPAENEASDIPLLLLGLSGGESKKEDSGGIESRPETRLETLLTWRHDLKGRHEGRV